METEPTDQLERLEAKVDAIYESVEKTRKYFQIILWVTVILIVLPAIGMLLAIPSLIDTYTTTLDGLM